MSAVIIQQGIDPIPQEAKICPHCGNEVKTHIMQQIKTPINPLLCAYLPDAVIPLKLVPEFHCEVCHCIWQWHTEEKIKNSQSQN